MKHKTFYSSRAWYYFSWTIKLIYSKDYIIQCSTCNKIFDLRNKTERKKLHCGHLIKVFEGGGKTNFSTAFDFTNVAPQCYTWNVKKAGNELKLLEFLKRFHGENVYKELKTKAFIPHKLDAFTMLGEKMFWQSEFKKMLEKRNYKKELLF